MDFDLLVRGGLVVDGSGLPGFRADVGVKDGKIAAIGRLTGGAARTIDAAGLVVAPGFVDHHTHLDAQLFWDPYGTSEPQHGVTSVVMGNCALTLAPVREQDRDALVQSFVRVEAMPRAALQAGVPWGWESFGDYLDTLEGRVGINVGGLVGHIAVRQYVLGEEAVERAATPDEVARMQAIVRQSMLDGALGLSTNRNGRHMREDGKPIASRLANDEEFFALCDVVGELNTGVIQTSLGIHTVEDIDWYEQVAERTLRPVVWQSVRHRWVEPDLWRDQLDRAAQVFAKGLQTYAITSTVPLGNRFTMQNAQLFDEFTAWKNVMFLPEAVRRQALADPETRQKLRVSMAAPSHTSFHRRWDLVEIIGTVKPENKRFEGKSVADLAEARGQDPLDAFLDLSLEEDLQTTFWSSNSGGDPEAVGSILRSPYVLVGQSDAGAHIQFLADFGYGTSLLGLWVRERGALTLEHAIHKLTFQVASIYGIHDRGLLRPGYAADLAIFDPATVKAGEPEWVQDFPGDTKRLIQRSEGMHFTVVNGRVIYEDGALTGDLPGQVVRNPLAARRPVAV